MIIAIDPGVNGGMAWDSSGASCVKWTTLGDMYSRLYQLSQAPSQLSGGCVAYLEHVTSSPIMGKKACFTFGENFGEWKAMLYAAGIPTRLIKPQTWQRNIPGLSGKQGTARKKVLKEHAQQLFPNIKVTSMVQDALILLNYAKDDYNK